MPILIPWISYKQHAQISQPQIWWWNVKIKKNDTIDNETETWLDTLYKETVKWLDITYPAIMEEFVYNKHDDNNDNKTNASIINITYIYLVGW